jgi:predicted permease
MTMPARLVLEQTVADLRQALRALRASPAFTLTAVLSLAIGVGATTAALAIMETTYFRRFPVEDPERLVGIQEQRPLGGITSYGMSAITYERFMDYREETGSLFAGVAGNAVADMALRTGDGGRPVTVTIATGGYFDVLGVRPFAGRFWDASQDVVGPGEPMAVISHPLWQSQYGGVEGIIGTAIYLDGRPFTVIGVTPPEFKGTYRASDVWITAAAWRFPTGAGEPMGQRFTLFARLAPGVEESQADAALPVITERITPDENGPLQDARVDPLHAFMSGRGEMLAFLSMLLVVAGLALLIAALNVAGMLLVRGVARTRDFGVRLALGAGRARIVRQLLTETLVLFALAGLAGWPIASLVLGLIARAPIGLDALSVLEFRLNPLVLLISFALVAAIGVAAGLMPALRTSRHDLASSLRGGARGATAARSFVGSPLVVAQVAISVFLIFTASLFVQSSMQASAVDPGFDPDGVVTASVGVPAQDYEPERARAFYQELTARLEALPEIESVGFSRLTPFSNNAAGGYVRSEGDSLYARRAQTDLGWHETVRTELLQGRFFTAADAQGDVAIVNLALAEDMWGSAAAALGRRLEVAGAEWQIVGVVQNGKYISMTEDRTRYVYLDDVGAPWRSADLYARVTGDPEAGLAAIRRELAQVDPDVALERPRLLTTDVNQSLIDEKMGAWTTMLMGAVALFLAALGTYGMLAYQVERTRREIGVRMALGAQRAQIATMIVRRGVVVAIVGVLVGIALALPLAQVARSLFYGVTPTDALALTLAPSLMVAVVLLASWLPSVRAARVEPIVAIQSE